ncbi:hypothetical protein BCR36DRAFT_582308 [Piromyces finnis]|uniref:C2H2-type domain-containing protein n=1 Tax=Piromyces finnis TaxID=1754191 RepID=A0A1Y1VCI2_9FUNG|nr:hypothetical protein BCR36DRAFT_582308 [Piromyces finnis]|eukprot:ORX52896.1 hypothetical protein BCR36DRAFT_582308 [Piromyces finnis]
MFRKLPDKNKLINNNKNNTISNSYQNDNNEFVYIDNVNQVLDLRRLSIDTATTSSGLKVNNNINNQYQNVKYNGGGGDYSTYGSYRSYSMQMNYNSGYDSASNNTITGYDMNDGYNNYSNNSAYNNNNNNNNGAIVNENKENTISEWILYNNRQEFYNRVDNNQNFNNEYQSNEGKYYNYSNYSSSSYMKNNFQQIPNSGMQYSGIVSERHSIPYYETLPIPIYTSNAMEKNDDNTSFENHYSSVFDDNANSIQEKYTLTSKPESSYSSLTNPNPMLTSTNNYLYSSNNNNNSNNTNNNNTTTTTTTTIPNYFHSTESKPLTIVTKKNNDEEIDNYDNSYSTRYSASKPLLNSYSNPSYLSNSYTPISYNNNTMEYRKKRVSISSRSSSSQNYPIVITTSRQSNLNSRYPYSTVVEGSTSPLSKQRYNYDYQYQRSVPSTSYYNETAVESNESFNDSGAEHNMEDNPSSSDNEKFIEEEEEEEDQEIKDEYTSLENKGKNESGDINNKNDEREDEENEQNIENIKHLEDLEITDKTKENLYKAKSSTSSSPNTMLKSNSFSKTRSYKRSSFFSQVIESNNFKCPWPDCEQSFASVTLLNAHEIYSHGTPYPPYPLPQPTYAELTDARHRLLWHIKNNISTNPLNIYNSNYCSSVQSPSSSIYSSDSPCSNNFAKPPNSASSFKSYESSSTFTETKNTPEESNPNSEKDENKEKSNEKKSTTPEETNKQNENHIIKKISKMKENIPHLNIENIPLNNRQSKSSLESKNTSRKYTQSLSSTSATMQSLRVQIKVDIKEHLFHYLFTPYIRYSHYTKSYSCFFDGIQGRSIVGEILEDPDWDIRCEDEYSVSYIKMVEGSRDAGILFSWERKKVDEWFPPSDDENERPTLYNDIVTINFVVASTKKR